MSDLPRLLDLFCGAGGAAMGYSRAGFEVVGVDIKPMSHYPFEFHQADALEYLALHGKEFDAIHASPPCQRYSIGTARWHPENYPDLLNPVEDALLALGKPFVIENVMNAPFRIQTFTLCGIQFGLNVIRHRRFATNFAVLGVPHEKRHPNCGEYVTCAGHGGNGPSKLSDWKAAMGIEWMDKHELAEAVPPVYTQFIGRQMLKRAFIPREDYLWILRSHKTRVRSG